MPAGGIDWKFLRKFRQLILSQTKKGQKFFLIVGGGATTRHYISSVAKVMPVTDEDKDWLGIHSTRLNAHLLRTIFRDVAHPEIIKNPTFRIASDKKVIIAGGWKPGWSTDYVATLIAQEYGVKNIINLSNIDYVCDKDPKKHKGTRKFKEIGWRNFRKLVGHKWRPGMNAPFDPVASQKAESLGLSVAIMHGKNFSNLKKYLESGKFRGTLIK